MNEIAFKNCHEVKVKEVTAQQMSLLLRDRLRRLALPQDIHAVHCWLINPNKFNLLSWLLAYLSNK